MSEAKALPYTIEPLPEPIMTKMNQLGFAYKNLVRTKPHDAILKDAFVQTAHSYRSFPFRPDDVVIATYPKSGTHWTGELLWGMKNYGHLHKADDQSLTNRAYFIDFDMLDNSADPEKPRVKKFLEQFPEGRVEDGITLQTAAADTSGRRVIRTHLYFDLLNPDILDTCKVIYVARNPKDVCVSYFHHCANSTTVSFKGSFHEFVEAFTGDGVLYGRYWDHVRQAWQRRHHPNLHFMLYEDMKKDVVGELRKLNDFLNMTLTNDQLKEIADNASFGRMKDRHAKLGKDAVIPNFYRKGVTGDWVNHADDDLNAKMDQWIEQNCHGVDIPFIYS